MIQPKQETQTKKWHYKQTKKSLVKTGVIIKTSLNGK